uniref:Ig-like domain-containing protein n=1 Tax=Macrostomum lignano TaxID=282301 RepID=A0A1I8F6X4_9PLAT
WCRVLQPAGAADLRQANSTVRLSCTVSRARPPLYQCGSIVGRPDANIRNSAHFNGRRAESSCRRMPERPTKFSECLAAHSVPPAEISFTVVGWPLTPLDRYRVVRLSTGSAALIIGKVLLDDGGKRQTVQSGVETLLIVKHAVAPRSPITVAAPGRREITLTEGDNATYSCITESSPIAEVSYLRDSGRRQLPASATRAARFTGIGLADQGAYACRVSYRPDLTSSGHMREREK